MSQGEEVTHASRARPQSCVGLFYHQPFGQNHPKMLATYKGLGNIAEHIALWGACL